MDRLVKADVKEIELVFKRNQKCTKSFRISNLMHTMSVAISLSTTKPSLFTFNQPLSIIPPLSTSTYTLISLPSEQPSLSSPLGSITVRSSMLPTGKASQDDLRRLFSRPGPHVFKDANIPISFTGFDVVQFLISRDTQVPDTDVVLSKAILGCERSQLGTLLRSSVACGDADMVSSLIDGGADVNVKDLDGMSLISLAVRVGKMDVLTNLIAAGCEINDGVDRVLHEAAAANRVDLMEVLCACFGEIDVNGVDSDGRTPIHIGALNGSVEIVKFCVSVGGKIDVVDFNGWSPLHCASSKGHLSAVEYLLDHCTSYVKYKVNKDGKTAFAVAADNGHSHLYDCLHLGDVLHRAARVDDIHGLKTCLAEGADVNVRDQNGWTALHRAAFKGRVESVKILLDHGACIDAVDDAGYTPLHCAVEAGHVQVAVLLIARGGKGCFKSLKGSESLNMDGFKHQPTFLYPSHPKEELA